MIKVVRRNFKLPWQWIIATLMQVTCRTLLLLQVSSQLQQHDKMLFYFSLAAFLSLLVLRKWLKIAFQNSTNWIIVAYRYRAVIIPYFPDRVKSLFPKLSNYTPLSTFSDQVGAGMTSTNFDIEANISGGDSRMGLDERSTQEVLEIMRRERVKYVLHFFPRSSSYLTLYTALIKLDSSDRIVYSLAMALIHQVCSLDLVSFTYHWTWAHRNAARF